MKLLSAIHRWTGGLIGLLLALLGLSGAILVWEGSWVTLPGAGDALAADPERLAALAEAAAQSGELSRITFASEEIGLHQLVFADGSGAYVDQAGRLVERWSDQWQRPELWLFDLHHHLFTGETGETVTGIAGAAGIVFALTGFILWWRGRARFRPTLLPRRFAPGPIVSHHRDLGLLLLPLLLLSFTTGMLMIFDPLRGMLLGEEERPEAVADRTAAYSPAGAIEAAAMIFPGAEIRRITLPSGPGGPIGVRLRQPTEWTPNGRTQVSVDGSGAVTIADSARANRSAWAAEKLYPIHSAKVGGWPWKAVMTLSGLGLALLGSLTVWSFWWRRASARGRRRRVSEQRRQEQFA